MLSDRLQVNSFTEFVDENELRIRRALTAAYGADRGREGAADAFVFAWQHWDRVSAMENPSGYLYRVGANRAKAMGREPLAPELELVARDLPWVEPGLAAALASLSERQRTIAVLVHSYEWSIGEVADLLGISKGSAQTHLLRAMRRLQRKLRV